MNNPGSFRDNLFFKLTVFVIPSIFKRKKAVFQDSVICIYCSDTRFSDSYLVNNQSVLFVGYITMMCFHIVKLALILPLFIPFLQISSQLTIFES